MNDYDEATVHDDRPRIGYIALRTNTHGEIQWSISVPVGATTEDMDDTIAVALHVRDRMDKEFPRPTPKDRRRR